MPIGSLYVHILLFCNCFISGVFVGVFFFLALGPIEYE